MAIEVKVTQNNVDQILDELHNKVETALTLIGMEARTRASENAPKRTGTLARSYTFEVHPEEESVYVGASVGAFPDKPYARYVELGTRKMHPQPHLKPAIQNNMDVYIGIAERTLKN